MNRFAFSDAPKTAVLVCTKVRYGAPVLHVSHDSDGDWQFLCGGAHGEAQNDPGLLLCLEEVVAQDLTLNEIADLHENWSARRDGIGGAWRRDDHSEEFIADAVKRHGWAVELIEEGDRESQPAFAYTVGLHRSYGAPELIVVGLPHEIMGRMLNDLGARIKAGETLPVGEPVDGILEGYPVLLRKVESRESYRAHVGYALWFNKGCDFPLVQVLWPDRNGRFPGQPGVDPPTAAVQLRLP